MKQNKLLHITHLEACQYNKWALRFVGSEKEYTSLVKQLHKEHSYCAHFDEAQQAWILEDITLFKYWRCFYGFLPKFRTALKRYRERTHTSEQGQEVQSTSRDRTHIPHI